MVGRRGGGRHIVAASTAALVLAGLAGACHAPSRTAAPAAAGSRARAGVRVEFADLDRIHATLKDLSGKPVFVNFWASWCVPCVDELPDLAALAREEALPRAAFLGISLDAWVTGEGEETEEKVRQALAAAGVGYPNLIYRGDQDPLIEGLDLPGPIPYSILYDARGKRLAVWTGPAVIDEVRRAIAAASSPAGTTAPRKSSG
jgi:thiol-disulfide isomerase/thioredoxin